MILDTCSIFVSFKWKKEKYENEILRWTGAKDGLKRCKNEKKYKSEGWKKTKKESRGREKDNMKNLWTNIDRSEQGDLGMKCNEYPPWIKKRWDYTQSVT